MPSTESSKETLVLFISVFLLTWYTIFHIPTAATGMLLKFIRLYLHKLSVLSGSEVLYKMFPNSLAKIQSLHSFDKDKKPPKYFAAYSQEDIRGKN